MNDNCRTGIWIGALLLALAVWLSIGVPARAAIQSGRLDVHALKNVAWHGRRYEEATGESVNVLVSPAYAADPGTGKRWADFFASLVHGSELSLLTAYIAPLDEVQSVCEGADVLGCYQGDRLVTVGEPAFGVSPQAVAAHEYGHHVAYNRLNPPWVAVDWGTKRWATYENVCGRRAAGTAFPGDEGIMYTLNPGEAFAESFRVLNGYGVDDWSVVDPSFHPDPTALSLIREDVLDPWTQDSARTVRASFTGSRTWTLRLTTPLDGDLVARVNPGADDLTLVSPDGRAVLAQGTWSTGGAKAFDYRICGQRDVVLRVTRHTSSRRFTVRLSSP